MGNEEQDIDEEGQKRYQKRREGEDEQREQVPWRMGGRVEVGSNSESKADQRHKSSNGVHNKNGREGMARVGGQREVGVGLVLE